MQYRARKSHYYHHLQAISILGPRSRQGKIATKNKGVWAERMHGMRGKKKEASGARDRVKATFVAGKRKER